MAKKVFIAPGHGGTDPGAVANGFKEKDLNLTISLACKAELERHGVSVSMSRSKDESETLSQQVNECNAFLGSDGLAINIHNNAGGGDGAEVYYYSGGGTSKVLADNILAEVVAIGQNSRGAKIKKNAQGTDYYGWIRQTYAPAVIVECAFLDNAKDIQIIDTVEEQKAMGIAIAKGALKTLGIAYVPEVNKTETVDVSKYEKEIKSLKEENKSLKNEVSALKSKIENAKVALQ